ncbi:SusD/RagB family nutrient-binding outer membrane lipoprotein [Flavivirga spongiicola]|uniref:SusD/RagB family nutrient-binding outer membrane lipoprotein n=1 Tax=Flavivirga spongiicola TaxID=421621 RepID=A0ABU7XU41_9FLAO|nr:SusD/RagB family nutrient-binding outer membrane lipoprotein [Flavivirga sp. MEBiC05379]MDO5979092.1 SusD/RagB family nutrient-binding outer membrane lipoprotein [Flavivirga sp. MEBiC05379]
MRLFKISLVITFFFSVIACQSIVDDINDIDPNKVASVSGEALFTGIQLADITSQAGILSQAGGVVAGYYVGADRLGFIQNYEYINSDSNRPWSNIYQGVVKQARELRSGIEVPNKDFFYGASKVLEAHAVGTAANIFGDVPFTEAANDDISTPKYDGQANVYASLQSLLDEAISDLQTAGTSGSISEDIFFGGDSGDWVKVAYTLKARLYLDVRDYANALSAAQNGISSASETMKYSPPNELGADTNLLYEVITGSTTGGALAANGSFLIDLLGTGAESRNNTKTDEVDRAAYYYDGTDINDSGIAAVDEPMNQISLQENLLIWAETSLRSSASNFDMALTKLNEHRANLRNGVYFSVSTGVYDDYVSADFEVTGIENVDGSLSKEDALLREIIEERYATFFTTILGFNDLRRMKKDPVAIQVPVPFNVGSQHPERFLYPFDEENTNGANVPDIADIFVKTQINQ